MPEIIFQSTASVGDLQSYSGLDNGTQVIVRCNCDYLVYLSKIFNVFQNILRVKRLIVMLLIMLILIENLFKVEWSVPTMEVDITVKDILFVVCGFLSQLVTICVWYLTTRMQRRKCRYLTAAVNTKDIIISEHVRTISELRDQLEYLSEE